MTRSDDGDGQAEVRVECVPVPVGMGTPGGTTNAYVIDVPEGRDRRRILVDPAARADDLDAVAFGGGTDGRDFDAAGLDAIAVTHTHPDHVGAVAAYAAETDATVYAHADHVNRFRGATGIEPDATIADGDVLESDAVGVLETPGHAPDGLSFVVDSEGNGVAFEASNGTEAEHQADSGSIIVGDLAVASGSVAVAAPDGDLADYLESLERLRDRNAARLWPGHGPPIWDPEATSTRLIEHRLDRERRILEAIEDGASDVDAILEAAYAKDLTGVEDLARRTVVAHVEKLVSEGRIDRSWESATGR